MNPLVAAGLIPENLSDILITPPEDAVVAKKRTKCIVGARHLTSDDFAQMLRDEERKKKETEEMKELKKAEREQKKRERLVVQEVKRKIEERMKKREAQKDKGKKQTIQQLSHQVFTESACKTFLRVTHL